MRSVSPAMARRATLMAAAIAVGSLLSGCPDEVQEVVLHRSNCLVCHAPLDDEGDAHGIEDAHPWHPMTCVDCHGGTNRICDGTMTEGEGDPECDGEWVYDKAQAHVSAGDGPTYLKNLTAAELDEVDPAFVRFINPGDYRVAEQVCGPCHEEAVATAPRSSMAHTSGEITVARYRAMAQEHPRGIYAAVDLVDPAPDEANICGVETLEQFAPTPMEVGGTTAETEVTVANAQDLYMVKSCLRCHVNDFGENRFKGDFRSSGCSACHMPYNDDGLSQSADPRVSKQTVPHAATHEMTSSPPISQCTHCHYRGGRLGISYQGYRESGGAGLNPDNPDVLGENLHGHDANYYLTDEDNTNDWDETPADVHFEAGMHCIDCHMTDEVHGDGHLYADTQCAVKTECEDCHGTVRDKATLDPRRNNMFEKGGKLFIATKVTKLELEIPQTADVVDPTSPQYNVLADLAMGVNDAGYSHTDDMECYTCHAGWLPSCYGCHVDVDMSRMKQYQSTGHETAGFPTGGRRWVVLNDLVLMRNTDGLIAPSMPAERLFMTVTHDVDPDGDGEMEEEVLINSEPRTFTFPDGRKIAGFGQRTYNPHTTRTRSQFMACDRCHTVGDPAAPDNAVLLDITYGFGSERFPVEACDVTNDDPSCDPETDWVTYQQDAIQTKAGEPLVAVGHPDPHESRPLTVEEIDGMRQVIVPDDIPYTTDIPADAKTNPTWPQNKAYP